MSSLTPGGGPTKRPEAPHPTGSAPLGTGSTDNWSWPPSPELAQASVHDARESARRATKSVSIPGSDSAASSLPANRVSIAGWVKRAALTFFSSSEIYSSAGSFLVSLTTISGSIGHPLCGLWAAWNQFKLRYLKPEANRPERDSVFSNLLGKYYCAVKEMLNCPALYRIGLSATFSLSAIEALGQGHGILAIAFALYAAANGGAARLLNKEAGFHAPALAATLPIRLAKQAWGAVPARLRTVLANPAPFWSVGDAMVGLMALNHARLPLAFLVVPTAIATAGALTGIAPIFRKQRLNDRGEFSEPSAVSLVLSSLTNVAFAAANFYAGSIRNAIALSCWAVTVGVFAFNRFRAVSINTPADFRHGKGKAG